jgi:hypothetical protein
MATEIWRRKAMLEVGPGERVNTGGYRYLE